MKNRSLMLDKELLTTDQQAPTGGNLLIRFLTAYITGKLIDYSIDVCTDDCGGGTDSCNCGATEYACVPSDAPGYC
jgi:hypothetical protein